MKTSGLEEFKNEELERIASELERLAAQTRASGTASTAHMDYIVKANRYIIVLRSQLAGKEKPGIRQPA